MGYPTDCRSAPSVRILKNDCPHYACRPEMGAALDTTLMYPEALNGEQRHPKLLDMRQACAF